MKNTDPIIVTQLLKAPIKTVWKAITELEQMRQWYFPNIPDFRLEVSFETRFLVQNEGRDFTHIWKIKEVIPHKLIGYSWNFEEYSGEGYSTFELTEKSDVTELTLKSYVIEAFPADLPEFKRESGQAGWEYLIQKSLPDYLAKQNG
ncbi:SRPBCC family protein [Maribacter aestuarii]|uniref:SRPBCC family protein n=1 Tax=Maribacter aestuarii TaxID=1130723 RepID=UPI00248C30F8|nr:SRPBCC domain-containing protein [Maribacter aestuarii]